MSRISKTLKNNINYQEDTLYCLRNFLQKSGKKAKLCNLSLNITRKLLKKNAHGAELFPSVSEQKKVPYYAPVTFGMQPIEDVFKLLNDGHVKVISFDIFDTLLCRPCILPSDIFKLIAKQVDEKYKIDFFSLRKEVEEESVGKNVNIDDLYLMIEKKSHLSHDYVQEIKNIEISIERELLFPRKEIKKVYEYAVKLGKKVIATSDMYIPGEILYDILKEKGYVGISAVYVSCDYNVTKYHGGKLFEKVLEKENILNTEIMHLGDNIVADYEQPLKKGILSFYYPSVFNQIYKNNTLYKKIFPRGFSEFSLGGRLIYGFLFNYFGYRVFENSTCALYQNAYEFGLFGLAPVLVAAMMNTINNKDIQSKYKKIYFASRDGYLPLKTYQILINYFNYGIPGEYFYAGRRIYYPATAQTVKNFINIIVEHPEKLTIKHFLDNFVFDEEIKESILGNLLNEEQNVTRNNNRWFLILSRFSKELELYLSNSRKGLYLYYRNIFQQNEKRHLVFDCGHSGSISIALEQILPSEKFDKLYMMQTEINKKRDIENATKTFSLLGDVDNVAKTHVFEECFSPYDDAPLFVDYNGLVHVAPKACSTDMENILTQIHKGVEDFANAFASLFSSVFSSVYIPEVNHMSNKMKDTLYLSPCSEVVSMFDCIAFKDIFSNSNSLGYKISEYQNYSNFFEGSGFVNPNSYIALQQSESTTVKSIKDIRICIHLHLFYIDLISEFLYYLRTFPFYFDLVVTSPFPEYERIIKKDIVDTCPNLKDLKFIACPNVGRDVAPWIVEMSKFQENYDLICHVHSKKTEYLHEMGEHWRNHLLENLLSSDMVEAIINTFLVNPQIGCLSPAPFIDHVNAIWNSTWLFGKTKEELEQLLERMNIVPEMQRDKLLYSIGTMFWYRPDALRPLFDLHLKYDDFPHEPLCEQGSIAHAIEHIINYVCIKAGYEQKLFLPKDIASSPFSRLAFK